MGQGIQARTLQLLVALLLVVLAFGLANPATGTGTGADVIGERSAPDQGTVTVDGATGTAALQDSEINESVGEILGVIPEELRAQLPDGFVEETLRGLDDELVVRAATELEQFPDILIGSLLNEVSENIPERVLNNATELVENPPDEIPSPLCRAADMPEKADPGGRENWGPTNANAQVGNQNLTITTDELGTVTTFKYPNPSYADQVKHHAFDRREPYYGTDPNAGNFLGLRYTTADGEQQLDWLRDWGPVSTSDPNYAEHVDMYWADDMSDTLVTEYTNESLGLTVTVVDAVPTDLDVHIRDVRVEASEDSPVTDVSVVSYANFNLVTDKDALIPTQGWCNEAFNNAKVTYDDSSDAIVYEPADYDPGLFEGMVERAGPQFSVATAMAFDGESSQHQIAGDQFMGESPRDPFGLLSNGSLNLPGNSSHTGQVSTALTRDISFENGTGSARVYFGAAAADEPGRDLGENATAVVESARDRSLESVVKEKAEWFDQYIGDAPLPAGAPENVTRLSKRALVSLVQVWDPYTENQHGLSGNIVAAVPTQAPYGADWIRDGAYFNYALDRFFGEGGDGLTDWVNQHNRWYKSLQQNRDGDCPEHCNDNMQYYDLGLGILPEDSTLRDAIFDALPVTGTTHEGSWAMNYYADGVPAGPLGGEIDETAYGAWTFWDHYAVTENETYLREIYPAIRLVGDRLTEDCVDEETGLQCPRPEDDNPGDTQTAVGGASVYAGLDAAAKAAGEMYQLTGERRYAEDAAAYAERRDELRVAMDEFYWNDTAGTYGSGRVAFPAFVRPVDSPRMQTQLQSMWENVNQTFSGEADAGQYEAKNLIGLGIAARLSEEPPVSREQLRTGLEWLADEAARSGSTHVMGEAWIRETYAEDEVDTAVSQPHLWQQILNYKAALLAYGNESIEEEDLVGREVYQEWRNHDATLAGMEMDGEVVAGDTAEVSVTVDNKAPVDQAYHLTYRLSGPDGQQYNGTATDIGPVAAGGSKTVTLSWDTVDAPAGEYDVTVAAWKAAATNDSGDPDPVEIAEEPTALANPEYRQVRLDSAAETLTLTRQDPGSDDGGTDSGGDTGDDGDDTGDDGDDSGDDGGDTGGDGDDGSGPGFGVAVVALALLGAALLAWHRQARR